jgi:hypothetical protein
VTALSATPTPAPTPVTRLVASPFGEQRLDLTRPRSSDEIDNRRLGLLAATGRVEQPEVISTPDPEPDQDAIWRELAARADHDAQARQSWRSRLQATLTAASMAEEALTLAEAEVGAAWIAYLREKKTERRELVLAPRLEVARGRLGAARQRLARAQNDIQAVRREARRAGVPPGWLRDLDG